MHKQLLPALVILSSLAALPLAAQQTHGIEIQNMDKSVVPGDNFYLYANGDWIKRTEIPADRGGIGVFSTLDDQASKNTAAIIAEYAKQNAQPGTDARKIADLYQSYMDEAAIEKRGLVPLKPRLAAIAQISNKQQLATALGKTLRADVDALNNTNFHTQNLFGLWVAPGFADSDHYEAYLLQGGDVLPSRDLYLDENDHAREVRAKYLAHATKMFQLLGYADAATHATNAIRLERDIAEKQISLADDEDVHKANNVWTMADFNTKAPGLDWQLYFAAAGLASQKCFYVWQPTAFAGESALVASVPLDTWKDWLTLHLVEEYANVLPSAFAQEEFDFFGKQLYGVPQQRPRDRRAIGFVNGVLGDAVGRIYAERYFSAESKQQAQAMVANIIAAFHRRIDALQWMDPATRAEANKKLDTLYVGVGYPETWKDYRGLDIKDDDLFGNVERTQLWELHRQIARLGHQVDKREWSMDPQTVNAVNLPLQNALNFPAAILQPPFFDAKAPAAVNYGAIGSIIGHEISHTFDTEGSTFDSTGKLRNWWTAADLAHFDATTARLAAQYDAYMPFPDLHVNGKQTLAENIADNGGISAAYDGYRASMGGKPAPMQDGFTGDQQFFIAFAQNWGSKAREKAMRGQVMTDPHSPAEYRADEVRNVNAWYAVFDVKPGQKLYLAPADRVNVW